MSTIRTLAHAVLSFVLASLALTQADPARADFGVHGLGINTHVPSPERLDMCVDLGLDWIRVDGNWDMMNPASGTFDYAVLDGPVDGARTRGLNVFMSLGYTPAWVPRVARSRSDAFSGNDEPVTSTEWVAFVEDAVRHFRARGVTHFGMWNEANLDSFWESPAGSDAWIDKILIPGAAAVRRVCTDCVVLGPELAHVGSYDTFLNNVLARASSSIDTLSHHTYNGWPETGTGVFDGDTFLQALEMRRFPFTRASLREVLDAHGWTGEVWITETGYRATPGDAAEEANQATYVRRVMEENLARPWWTNTFFYEIMDCGIDEAGCTIDGFGITRPTRDLSGGPRAFPGDFRTKPAYDEIRSFVMANPGIVGSGPLVACANGTDDDGDGRIDSEDRGCVDGLDADESDDPARERFEALPAPAGGITLDGDLAEWGPDGAVALAPADWVGVGPLGGGTDLSVTAYARWAPGTLWVAIDVIDDVHVNDRSDDTLWAADSVQLAFDVGRNYGSAYDSTDDHELTIALVSGAAHQHRFVGPAGAGAFTASVSRSSTSNRTTYEIELPMAALTPATLGEGTLVGFSFLVNDNDGLTTEDGTGREGWEEWTPGIGRAKVPYDFGELALVSSATPPGPDAGVAPGTDGGVTPGTDGSVAPGTDGGVTPRSDGSTSTPPPATDSGCGCDTAGSSRVPHTLGALLALLALAALSRRRSLRARSARR